jgi:chorismate mutase/prephenate dehydratase
LIVSIAFFYLFATYKYKHLLVYLNKGCFLGKRVSNNQEYQSLEMLRSSIDELDSELLKLLNKRAKCVIKIGRIKQKEKQDILVPLREKELMDRLLSVNKGPMKDTMVIYLFQQIIDTLKELQK